MTTAVVRRRLQLSWSLLGVPALFAVFVKISYQVALRRGDLPFLRDHEWRWWTAFALLLCSGAGCIFHAAAYYVSRRSLAVVGYLVVMGLTLFLVAFSVSCMQGDCL
jgi:hypothetical protein